MIESLNHVPETQTPLRVPQKVPEAAASAQPFELPPAQAGGTAAKPEPKEFRLFGSDGFDVFDVLDMINPLQHIPVISTIYRRLTGDELSPGARIIGATLLGGPIGATLAMADSAVEYETGKDTGANVYAALFGDEGPIPAAGTAVAAAPWQDPDLVAETVTAGGGTVAFAAAATRDLEALSDVTTGAGGHITLDADAAPQPSAKTSEPAFVAAPWKNPDLEPLDAPTMALLARINEDTLAIEAEAREQTTVAAIAEAVSRDAAPAPASRPAPINVERPMPSEAAKAQAINALAAMPTSQTTAAVAELARSETRTQPRHHMAPPAGDIPRGAAASLSRRAMSAYATSMANAKPTKAEAVAAADAHNADAIAKLERSTGEAQNDWMLEAMQRAMAKYEASAKLRAAANAQDGEGPSNAGGISVTR
jgi:hypothetical protein